MNESERSALSILLADLLEEILIRADNPGECSTYLAGRIREIVGVKTVLLFQYTHFSDSPTHELISAVPDRRRSTAEFPFIEKLLEAAHVLRSSRFIDPEANPEELSGDSSEKALKDAGIGPSILVPLRYGDSQVGALLLLDIMDRHNLGNLIFSLDRLSGVLALILRNSFMYARMEEVVRLRTADLLAEREQLRSALAEKNVLLQEVHHRVKNNLQIIESLLYLQGQQNPESPAAPALLTARGRISSMALVHEDLYAGDDLSSVDLGRYVPRLTRSILDTHDCGIVPSLSIDPLKVSLNAGIHIGLILNELITNAVKYAFRGRNEGRLEIWIERDDANCCITLEDDGPGLPACNEQKNRESLGMSIVRSLAEQFGGEVHWSPGEHGFGGHPGLRAKVRLSRESLER